MKTWCSVVVVALIGCGNSSPADTSDAGAQPDSGSDAADATDTSTPDGGGGGDGASGQDSGASLPLGTLTVTKAASPMNCPKGAAPGASCTVATVSCPGEPDLGVTLADVEPTIAVIGTVIAHDGGAGTGFYDGNTGDGNSFAKSLTAKGYRFVQVAWANDWATTGKGIKLAGCRPATTFQWVFDNIHQKSRSNGFCGMGASGGTAAMLYSIAAYGLKNEWDYMQLAAGPTPARIDYGCNPSLYTGGPIDLCPQLTNAPYKYDYVASGSSSIVNIVDGWEGTTTCDSATPPAADVSTWADDSLLSPTDDLHYPQTSMSFWYCVTTPNMSTGQGAFFVNQVQPMNKPSANCYTGTCTNEEVFMDPTAFDAAVTEMTTSCVPNHMGQ